MTDYKVNVLFVPFNAAQRQYERNEDKIIQVKWTKKLNNIYVTIKYVLY